MTTYSELLSLSRHILLDGAIGTALHDATGIFGPTDRLNFTQPGDVIELHKSYVTAGSDIITTNTLNAPTDLAHNDWSAIDRVFEGLDCANAAIDGHSTTDHPILIALSLGQIGHHPNELVDLSEPFRRVILEVARTYRGKQPDVIWLESQEPGVPLNHAVDGIINAFVELGRTYPVHISSWKTTLNPSVGNNLHFVESIGLNCLPANPHLVSTVKELAAKSTKPILLKPNPPIDTATVETLLRSGAKGIGACCGSDPQTITDLATYLTNHAGLLQTPL